MKIITFERRPFQVEGVQVTEENMQEVAEWCGGHIRQSAGDQFIKVKTHRPLNEKQTQAFVGDWVLKAVTGFKVYTNTAMENSFKEVIVYTEEDAHEQLYGTRNVFDTHGDVEEILKEGPEELIEDLVRDEPSGPESQHVFSKFLEEE